jgi:WD40 repeat protein
VELWNAVTQQPVRTLTVNTNTTFNSVQFSPDGKTVAAGGDTLFPGADGGTVGLWNTATGQQIGQIEDARNGGLFEGLTFSPDGQTLATISDTVRLWNVATRRQTGKPLTVADEAISPDVVAFSPDGHTLAVGYNDGTVRLWNPATQRQVGQPITAGADWPVDAMAFSPDGQTLAVGDTGGTVRLWNAATGQQIGQPLTAGKEGINGVAFRPNGRTLVTASADGIRVWDVSPLADPLTQVCGQLGGDLSTAWSQYVPAGLAYNGVCP